MRRILLLSTSTVHGTPYMQCATRLQERAVCYGERLVAIAIAAGRLDTIVAEFHIHTPLVEPAQWRVSLAGVTTSALIQEFLHVAFSQPDLAWPVCHHGDVDDSGRWPVAQARQVQNPTSPSPR